MIKYRYIYVFFRCFSVGALVFGLLSKTSAETLDLPKLGEVSVLKPVEIEKSPFSLGAETLDRERWDPKEVYPFIEKLGVKWTRLQTGWARTEVEKGKYDFEWLDEAVDGLIDMGIQPWLSVSYGNPLYLEGGPRFHPLANAAAYEAWKRYVAALTHHYKDRIQHYEIWNEPNAFGFWKPDTPDPVKYTQLVKDTSEIIRSIDPDAQIIGGVTSRIPVSYIRTALEAGLADSIDIFSFHPYSAFPESFTDQILALRKLLNKYKPGINMWQGENGFPSQEGSTGFKGPGPWTENIQAKTMLRRLLLDCELGMDLSSWFIIIDLHDYPMGTVNTNWKGILRARPEIEPKKVYYSFQYLTSLVHGDVSPRIGLRYLSENSITEEDYYDYIHGDKYSMANGVTAFLNTEKGPVFAYWLRDQAMDKHTPEAISIALSDWEGIVYEDPVIVDPLNGIIYELPKAEAFGGVGSGTNSNLLQVWNELPITDYPLIIMEKANVLP